MKRTPIAFLLILTAVLLASCAAPAADEPQPEVGEAQFASLVAEGEPTPTCACIAGEKPGDKYVVLPEGVADWSELIAVTAPDQGIVAASDEDAKTARVELERVFIGTWRKWNDDMAADGWQAADSEAFAAKKAAAQWNETKTELSEPIETTHYTNSQESAVRAVYDAENRILIIMIVY